MRALAIAMALAACSAERPDVDKPDAMPATGDTLDMPAIDPGVPMRTPNGTIAIRGSTNGARVVVKGGTGDPIVQAALPTGGFCIDVPLASGSQDLYVYALKDGLISAPVQLTVTEDASAPIPNDAHCLGMEQPVCVSESASQADCSDGKDNDCNGLVDMCDPGCNMCVDDALGPNNSPFLVPMISAGTYQLQICPCTADWFAFGVQAGEIIHVKATFNTSVMDLDMMLQTPAAAENNSASNVAISNGTTNTEEITYTAASTGTYYLKVYPYDTSKSGAYTLTIY
jgi:hypothetical protein